jgi:UDP:flavonoid glycosyltransferase YjiC (YdhE family)
LHLCFAPADWVFRGWATEVHGTHVEAANEVGIRPRLADLGAAGNPTTAVERCADGPVVLCTFGTLFNKRPGVLRTVIAGLAERVAKLVVVLGPGVDSAAIGAPRRSVEVRERASIPDLLPGVDYVVTHGGASTLTALQLAGKPSLLFPQGADQPVNAVACQHRGLSVACFHTPAAVKVGAMPEGPMTPESVRHAFDALTANAGYAQRAHDFSASLDALPPLEHAVHLLERVATTREPVLTRANA